MCNCGCNVVFKVSSNIRGALIQIHNLSFILEDKLYNDSWENYFGGLRTWGEFKNKIIGNFQNMDNNNIIVRDNNNNNPILRDNNNNFQPNIWLHLYNEYILNDPYQNIPHNNILQTIYIY